MRSGDEFDEVVHIHDHRPCCHVCVSYLLRSDPLVRVEAPAVAASEQLTLVPQLDPPLIAVATPRHAALTTTVASDDCGPAQEICSANIAWTACRR